MLNWNETDLIECLEVLPKVGEHGISHRFQLAEGPVRVVLDVFQYDGDIAIEVYCDPNPYPFIRVSLLGCAGVRRIHTPGKGDFLEFAEALVAETRYAPPFLRCIQLHVKPHLRLSTV